MKLSLEKLLNMQQGVSRIAGLELEPKLSYRIAKILKKLVSELKIVEKERQKLIEKYGEKDEKGLKRVTEDNMESFKNDLEL